jgi:nanoRNase/pAp phosphatase (c-di-AMP/oligoRNAs hydrolase)
MASQKYRLVTRSDFDGLICALLLKEIGLIDDIKFVHPKDMQDGKIEITNRDITTNLPYIPTAHLAFDHHESEMLRVGGGKRPENHIIDPDAPSAARVVYTYFGGKDRFPTVAEEMMIAVDKADSAQFTREEILFPQDWVLLNYLMDPRSGLGRFRHFRISNYDLMMLLIDYCKQHTIEEILALPDVKERVDLYFQHQKDSMYQIEECVKIVNKIVILDLRSQEEILTANRFIIYAMYPECSISIHVLWGLKKQNTVFAVGKSIIDRSSKVDIGELMLKYGGGGHKNAGTCQVDNDKADSTLQELIQQIKADG